MTMYAECIMMTFMGVPIGSLITYFIFYRRMNPKTNTTTIWYSVQNCGDGSAYPEFFNTEEEANSHQDNMIEGWGEFCVGSIAIEHEGPINWK